MVALLVVPLFVVVVVVGLALVGTVVVVVQVVLWCWCCTHVGTFTSHKHPAQCSPCSP